MRKLISLFLVLVMFLMLAPVTLAEPGDINVTVGAQTWATGTSVASFSNITVTIVNDSATSTTINISNTTGKVEFEVDSRGGYVQSAFTVALEAGETITLSVRPDNSATAVNTYNDTIIIEVYDSSIVLDLSGSLSFSYEIVNAPAPPSTPTDGITLCYDAGGLSPITGNIYFSSQYVGYTPSSFAFYVKNTGTSNLNGYSVSIDNPAYFTLNTPTSAPLNAGSVTNSPIAIAPKSGLGVGTYSTKVTVTAGSATQSFNAYFSADSTGGSSSSSYSNRTLIDYTTGVRVSGLSIHNSAALSVTQNSLHSAGLCNACDTIRSYMSNGRVLSIYNISLTRGHVGAVNVSVPVSSGYNGNLLTMLHCNGGILESLDVYASNNLVTGAFSSLSPFAVLNGQYTNLNEDNGNVILPPKTGDPTSYKELGVLLILLTATAGFIVMRTKKKVKR